MAHRPLTCPYKLCKVCNVDMVLDTINSGVMRGEEQLLPRLALTVALRGLVLAPTGKSG